MVKYFMKNLLRLITVLLAYLPTAYEVLNQEQMLITSRLSSRTILLVHPLRMQMARQIGSLIHQLMNSWK